MFGRRKGLAAFAHLGLIAVLAAALPAGAATFAADAPSLGAIPDGLSGTPPQYGASKIVTFTVSGMSGSLSAVSLSINASHTWVGDLDVVLKAPGGAPSLVVFSRTGVTAAGSFGSSSDLNVANTYTFADTAVTNWWTAAAATPLPAGSYRTTAGGTTGQTNPPPVTSLNTTFAGLSAGQMNGTWTLTFRDAGASDTGSVAAASLTLTSTVAGFKPVDFSGDGRSDYAVVRNTGGGPSGAISWFISNAATSAFTSDAFGIATDFFVPGDFDGDGKADVAVWRPAAPGAAGFWIHRSSDGVAYFEPFGQSGDDPRILGDYDGDGKTDIAIYRGGATAGAQSVWWIKRSSDSGITSVAWGLNGDFPAPGDYDGDGKADFAVQRNAGSGQAMFWIKQSTAGIANIIWGTPTDVIVPGDYDGDGKTDLAVIRGSGGSIQWWIRRSSDLGIMSLNFGASATDSPCQGDYDGDGKIDVGIWRPSASPGGSAFWVNGSTAGIIVKAWGQNGDYPVANVNSH